MVYWAIVALCLAALGFLLLRDGRRRSGFLLLGLVALGVAFGLSLASDTIEIKGTEASVSWVVVCLLFLAMLAGMAAQYFFLKQEQSQFRWQPFIKPFLASPVVFVSVLAVVPTEQLGEGAFTIATLMLLLIAFQNGFFWKTVFDANAGKLKVEP